VSGAIEQFEIRVEDATLDDLRERLARTRIPDEIEGGGWDYGVPYDSLAELVDYWRDEYDWRAQEARLNALDHFRTTIDGQSIHFVHARATRDDAFPLLLIHGWPGSIVEFLDVIPRLRESFHVVVPSLPGYGFSEPPRTRGWDTWRIAEAFAVLMDRLGYARYGAQGGDWGAQVTTRIPLVDPEHCAAIHLNMPLAEAPKDAVELTDQEQADLAQLARFRQTEAGYAIEQSTKPQTIGAALNDSPAGLLAWIFEKFYAWSDPNTAYLTDQLRTNVMLYWVPQTAASSARLYWENQRSARKPDYVAVPTGVARYPHEILKFPRAWVERSYNVTHWADMPRGGHFAAMEQPELFADDVRTFFEGAR